MASIFDHIHGMKIPVLVIYMYVSYQLWLYMFIPLPNFCFAHPYIHVKASNLSCYMHMHDPPFGGLYAYAWVQF